MISWLTLDGDVLWDVEAVAEHCKIDPKSVDSYLYRKNSKFPQPEADPASLVVDQYAPGSATNTLAVRQVLQRAGGQQPLRLWRARKIIAWQAARPRAGVGGRRPKPKKVPDAD